MLRRFAVGTQWLQHTLPCLVTLLGWLGGGAPGQHAVLFAESRSLWAGAGDNLLAYVGPQLPDLLPPWPVAPGGSLLLTPRSLALLFLLCPLLRSPVVILVLPGSAEDRPLQGQLTAASADF